MTSVIRIIVGGDFCPIARIESQFLSGSTSYQSSPTLGDWGQFADVDLFIVNLECPLTTATTASRKCGPHLKAHPDLARLLKTLSVGLVTLANNHIGDFGEAGLADTLETCKAQGIATVGAGLCFEEATRTWFCQLKGRTLAVINMAEQEFGCSRPGRAGAHSFDVVAAVGAIRSARTQADHVLLIVHGGLEGIHFPSPESVRVLRFLAEEGASAIVRHHSHYVQGHEIWKGVPILYGLGNLLFDWFSPVEDEGWYQGILTDLAIGRDDACSVVIHPFEQRPAKPAVEFLAGEARKEFLDQYADWCQLISNESALRHAWDEIVVQRASAYLGLLAVPHPFLLRVLRRLGLAGFMSPWPWKRRLLENVLRNDAHRELLLDILVRG